MSIEKSILEEELEYQEWERKHPKHFSSPFDEFTIHAPASMPDCECAALAKKFNCRVVRDAP